MLGSKFGIIDTLTSPEWVNNRLSLNALAKTSRKQHKEVYHHAKNVQMDIW